MKDFQVANIIRHYYYVVKKLLLDNDFKDIKIIENGSVYIIIFHIVIAHQNI